MRNRGRKAAVIVTACVVVCALAAHFAGFNPVSFAVRTVFEPIENGFAYIADRVSDGIRFVWEMASYRDENMQLVDQINELNHENKDITELRRENERLKQILELQSETEGYSTLAASVIAYSKTNWYDTLEINKGSNDGVSVGNAVITKEGVVGRVSETGPNWATVSTILNKDNAMGVRVTRTSGLGVVEGDEKLCLDNLCQMTFINQESTIIVGDLLETSGSGGIYPAGLFVGAIREINADNTGELNYATVDPAVDFSRLYEVLVINGVN